MESSRHFQCYCLTFFILLPVCLAIEKSDRVNIEERADIIFNDDTDSQKNRVARQSVESRGFFGAEDYDDDGIPQSLAQCTDREVEGNCRYRTDPESCFSYKWTALATIHKDAFHSIQSQPPGLLVPVAEGSGKVRVYITVSCCTPIVQFYQKKSLFNIATSACTVDVRELQGLHPGEIAGIAAGVILLIIIIIIIALLLIRRSRNKNDHTIFLGKNQEPIQKSYLKSQSSGNHVK